LTLGGEAQEQAQGACAFGTMISIKQAVDTIVEEVSKFPTLLPASDVHLEEFDFDGIQWIILLSFAESSGMRVFKTFVVDGDSGQIKSMRISPPKA
jgi:hypothetical protein